ncbi:hypothetical protein M5689_024450 [Euphorbia peplus]|nr:hypothetical protein M5689_024450 [Euphorbia peplus]
MRLDGLLQPEDHLYVLGLGFDMRVTSYSGIVVNGIRFHTTERDKYRRTQNSGVVVKGEHNFEEIDFYGALTDIIEIEFCHRNNIFVFKCDWWNLGDKNRGARIDTHLVSVNVSRKWYENDSFVLATQAEQAFYMDDIKNGSNGKIVQRTCPRNVYNVPENEESTSGTPIENDEPYQQYEANGDYEVEQNDLESLYREDLFAEEINVHDVLQENGPIENGNSSAEEDDTVVDYLDDQDEEDEIDEDDDDDENDDDDDDDEHDDDDSVSSRYSTSRLLIYDK